MVKEMMLALAHLYRDLAKQMEELETLRGTSSILADKVSYTLAAKLPHPLLGDGSRHGH